MIWDAVQAIASAVAVVISLVALGAAHRSQKRLTVIEEERRGVERAQEEKRRQEARFDVTAEKGPTLGAYTLIFQNRGPSDAWHVEYSVRWSGPTGWQALERDRLPAFTSGGPLQTRGVSLPADVSGFDVELAWSDNARPSSGGSDRFNFDRDGRVVGRWRA